MVFRIGWCSRVDGVQDRLDRLTSECMKDEYDYDETNNDR